MSTEEIFYSAILLALLCGSAFFSSSETALMGASHAQMRLLERQGNKKAGRVVRLKKNMERTIATIMLGNNAVNMAASAIAATVTIQLWGEAAVALSTAILTITVILFGEILPKTFAVRHADKLALTVAPVFGILIRIFSPITLLLHYITEGILRLFHQKNAAHPLGSASDILRGTIELHHEEGSIIKEDKDMLGGLLDMETRTVYDIMIHRKSMFTLDASLPLKEIVEKVVGSQYTRIPLWRDNPDNITGIIHGRDLLRSLYLVNGDVSKLNLDKFTSPAWFIPDTSTLKDQLLAFRARRSHLAIVVDEYGTMEGMVTLEDILEEIVGAIDDEHDRLSSNIIPQLDGTVIFDGNVNIRELNRELDWNLPDDEAATIAGLIMHEAREIPEIGAIYDFYNTRFEVLEKHKNRIVRVRAEKLATEQEAE